MGMFDWYIPVPDLICQNCKFPLEDWQGTDGACGLFVWKQGFIYPVEQRGDECNIDEDKRKKFRLPDDFIIYTECENCEDYWIEAECKTVNEVWTEIIEVRIESKKVKGKMKKATRNTWNDLEPFPDKSSRIRLKRRFTEEEFEKMSYGFVPESMDDHWFAFLENETLYYHRSWTGNAVYKVKFVKEEKFYIPKDVRLNRKGFKPIAYFLPKYLHSKLLLFLVQAELLEQDDPVPIPKFIKKVFRFIFVRKHDK